MARQPIEQRLKRAIKDITEKDADPRARWAKIKEDFPEEVGEIEAQHGELLEATLDDIDRAKAVFYAGRDADATFRIKPILWDLIQAQGLEGCYRMDLATIPMINRMQHVGMAVDKPHFYRFEKKLTEAMAEKVKELLPWTRDPEFNPNSPDQTAEFLFKKLGIVSKNKTPTGKESTNDKVLEAIRGGAFSFATSYSTPESKQTHEGAQSSGDTTAERQAVCGLRGEVSLLHNAIRSRTGEEGEKRVSDGSSQFTSASGGSGEVRRGMRELSSLTNLEKTRAVKEIVSQIIDFRELGTMRDDFCVKMVRLCGPDGRIRCTFRVTRVSSGRLSATTPNMLGIPVRTELGRQIREGFIAPPGRLLAGLDLDQIEMREIGFQSQDPTMRKAFRDGVDIHRLTGARVFGKKPEDVTTEERYASKRIGFGVITGITEEGLLVQMELAGATGWDLPRCRSVIRDYLHRVYPRVGAYLEECRAEARRNGFVRDRWGRIRYLPGVHSDISWIRYEAERQAHSFKISASAQGILKTAMAAIWEYIKPDVGTFKTRGKVEPLLQIHDELLFEGTEEYWDPSEGRLDEIRLIMCHSSGLGDIPIKAKGQTAQSWAGLKD